MSKPIRFRGKDYPSEEAMPPAIRIAYGEELFQAGAKEVEEADAELAEADEQLAHAPAPRAKPAWGGMSGGAGGVPVPVEFDAVKMLGPAVAVHLHTGGARLGNLGTPRPNELVIYRDGLAFRSGKDLHTWRWDEVALIQSNVWYSSHTMNHEYSLAKSSAEEIILDDGIKDIEDAMAKIKEAVFGRLLPALAAAYGAGKPLIFGPVTAQKETGIQLNGKLLGWPAILDVKSERGRFTVTMRDAKKYEARVSAIPNIEILADLIGLSYYETSYM